MRRVSLVAMVLAAAFAVPAAAQDRLEDRVVVNTLVGPGFVGESTVLNMRASAGVKATDWLTVVGEWGSLSKPNASTASTTKPISGTHLNGNVQVTTPRPIYYSIRPYGTAGVGTFRTAGGILSTEERSDFASNVGAGLAYDINRWVGVNFDFRRFFVDYEARPTEGALSIPSGGGVRGFNRFTFGVNFGLR